MRRRMSANRSLGMAISAIWNVTNRPYRTTLAPILISFSGSMGRDDLTSVVGYIRKCPNARICDRCWL